MLSYRKYPLKADRAFLLLMILAICQNTIFIFPVVFVSRLPVIGPLADCILPITYTILACMSYSRDRVRNIRQQDFFLIFFFFFFFIVSIIRNPACEKHILDAWGVDIYPAIPFFFLGLCFRPDKITMECLGKWCSFAVIFLSFYLLVIANDKGQLAEEYDMGAAYRLLASTMITINYALSSRKKFPIIASLIGVFYSLSMGTRGPLLVIIIFAAICFLYHYQITPKKKIAFIIIASILTFLFISGDAFIQLIVLPLRDFMLAFGVSTRILDLFLQAEIGDVNTRQAIYDFLFKKLSEQPLLGYGAYAEWTFGIQGAHRVYVEILFEYGYVLGSFIMGAYAITLIKAFKAAKGNRLYMEWLILWAAYVLLRGIWGERFISFQVFFLLGYCLNIIREKKRTFKACVK